MLNWLSGQSFKGLQTKPLGVAWTDRVPLVTTYAVFPQSRQLGRASPSLPIPILRDCILEESRRSLEDT